MKWTFLPRDISIDDSKCSYLCQAIGLGTALSLSLSRMENKELWHVVACLEEF